MFGALVVMVMMSGGLSVTPGLGGCRMVSGRVILNAGVSLNAVVTIRKISTTSSTSMSDTMMTEGARRRLWPEKFIANSSFVSALALSRSGCVIVLAQEFVADRFQLHGQVLDFLAVIAPRDKCRDGDEQPQ